MPESATRARYVIWLQTRLMDGAGDAQSLAAALNHSAFNMANALGPWLGGMAIAAGLGWTSTGWVGSALALCGLIVWVISRALQGKAHATGLDSIIPPRDRAISCETPARRLTAGDQY
jgi:predicted MFS family arabinose efflux permease